MSPEFQPDGVRSIDRAREITAEASARGRHLFEWWAQRLDGEVFPVEVTVTVIPANGRGFHLTVVRDITGRKRAEDAIRELNQTLERRIQERTAELSASEARLQTLVEHAPEAIVVFDGMSGRFEECNQNAVELFGLSRQRLLECTPADVSPKLQPDGRSSIAAARAWIEETRRGRIPVFDWVHRHSGGRLIPCEIRLVRLPGEENCCRIRGSITDNTERRRREAVQRATYEISAAVQATEDLDTLYRRIHEIIQGLMPARNFYIALLEPATGLITFPYHVDETTPQPQPMDQNTGLTGYVFRTGKPLLVNRRMPKRQVGEGVIFEGVQDSPYVEIGVPAAIWLGVPLMVHGRKLGGMAVQDYQSDEVYNAEHQRILMFVAEQTALAIEQKRAEQARRESEEKFRALFEATSQGVMLHDEAKFLEVNPAAVKILGFSGGHELIGKHPADSAAPIQPGGERADVLARKHIADCLAQGSTRFDWVCRNNRGQDIPVEVQVEPEGGDLVFRVSDRGIGIPPQDLEWLFNSFHRGRNVGHRPGTGLGLVIVKRCVERHGGQVQLHSLEREGTTVVVRLPLPATAPVNPDAAVARSITA